MNIRITALQLFLMMFVVQTGTVFISFQSRLINEVGRDAWWIFIALGILILPHFWLFERYWQDMKWNRLVSMLYVLYWFYVMVSLGGYVGYTLNVWVYPKTPTIVILILVGIVLLYLIGGHATTAINMGVILIPMILLFILFVLMGLKEAVWTNLLPVTMPDPDHLRKGMMLAQMPFVGIELYLLFRTFTQMKIKFWKLVAYSAVWLVFFMLMLMVPLVFFALEEFKYISEPIMYMLKSQDVAFVERLDLLFIYIWLAWSIITIGIYGFSIMRLLPKLGISPHRKVRNVFWMMVLFVVSASFLTSKETVRMSGNILLYAHLAFAVFLPFVVILFNRLTGKKKEGAA